MYDLFSGAFNISFNIETLTFLNKNIYRFILNIWLNTCANNFSFDSFIYPAKSLIPLINHSFQIKSRYSDRICVQSVTLKQLLRRSCFSKKPTTCGHKNSQVRYFRPWVGRYRVDFRLTEKVWYIKTELKN